MSAGARSLLGILLRGIHLQYSVIPAVNFLKPALNSVVNCDNSENWDSEWKFFELFLRCSSFSSVYIKLHAEDTMVETWLI